MDYVGQLITNYAKLYQLYKDVRRVRNLSLSTSIKLLSLAIGINFY